jgi:hypothetical protein
MRCFKSGSPADGGSDADRVPARRRHADRGLRSGLPERLSRGRAVHQQRRSPTSAWPPPCRRRDCTASATPARTPASPGWSACPEFTEECGLPLLTVLPGGPGLRATTPLRRRGVRQHRQDVVQRPAAAGRQLQPHRTSPALQRQRPRGPHVPQVRLLHRLAQPPDETVCVNARAASRRAGLRADLRMRARERVRAVGRDVRWPPAVHAAAVAAARRQMPGPADCRPFPQSGGKVGTASEMLSGSYMIPTMEAA